MPLYYLLVCFKLILDQTFKIMLHSILHNLYFKMTFFNSLYYLIEVPNTFCETSKSFQKIHATFNIWSCSSDFAWTPWYKLNMYLIKSVQYVCVGDVPWKIQCFWKCSTFIKIVNWRKHFHHHLSCWFLFHFESLKGLLWIDFYRLWSPVIE